MKSQMRMALGVFGGAAMIAAAGFGLTGGHSVSSATPTTSPGPAPATAVAPGPDFATGTQPDSPNGCIPGANCGPGPTHPQPHP